LNPAHDLKALIGTLNPVCRQSLEDAAALCVSRGHFTIEVEHLLRTLIDRPQTDLRAILSHFGVDVEELRRALEQTLKTFREGNARVPQFSAQLPLLFREAWLVSSLDLGASRTRSGAILLALRTVEGLRDAVTQSVPALRRLDPDTLRQELPALVRATSEAGSSAAPPGSQPPPLNLATPAAAPTPALDQYTLDLTARARAGEIDPIIGRDREIRQLIDILMRRRQNNPILTGEAGVGKTAVVEGLACRIAAGDVPPALRNVSVRMLDLALLQAGAGVKGEFESRLKSIIAEVGAAVQPIILFIDEAHTLIGAGGTAGQGDAANLLKPALARGELRTIAATTWSEYKRYFETDSALARRFQAVKVDEPSPEGAIAMLRGIVPRLEKHHGVRIRDEAVRDAVLLSHRYLSERQLPDKAIGVLDTASARVAIGQRSTPAAVEDALRTVERLEEEAAGLEREAGFSGGEPRRLGEVHEALERARRTHTELSERWREEQARVEHIRELEARPAPPTATILDERSRLGLLQGDAPMVPLEVDGRGVAAVISGWTGIPVGKMNSDEIAGVLGLEAKLASRVIGQRAALDAISRRIRTHRAVLDDPGKPVGVFLLVGPSGVGKTETAIALADALYGGERNMVTINLSEYQEAHTVSQLKGAPPGYVGHGRGGVLTEAVRRRPYTVVLLDEIEKAHSDVAELFYQVFDKGTLEDGEGTTVDFKHTVLLLTSNLGAEEIMRRCVDGERPPPDELAEALRPRLLRRFAEAFLGRLVVVPYYPLAEAELREIIELKLQRIARRFTAQHSAELTWRPRVIDEIAERCTQAGSGARIIDQILTHALLPELSEVVLGRMVAGEAVGDIRVATHADGGFRFMSPDDDFDDDGPEPPPAPPPHPPRPLPAPAAVPEPPPAPPPTLPMDAPPVEPTDQSSTALVPVLPPPHWLAALLARFAALFRRGP